MRGVDRLLELGWMDKNTVIEPFNYAEPFLNPDLIDILRILVDRGIGFRLSTNGSVYRKLPPDVVEKMEYLMISVPGFSQASYDRIHQLNAQAVRENIKKFSADLTQAGASGKLVINFHVYQFNLGELEQVREFAEGLGAVLTPHVAYFNDYALFQQYLTGTIGAQDLWDASRDLFLNIYHFDGVPEGYRCLLWNQLCFDHEYNLVPCCRMAEKDRVGNLFTDDPEELLARWRAFSECDACIASGQSTIVTNGTAEMEPLWYINQMLPKIREGSASRQALAAAEAEKERLAAACARLEEEKRGLTAGIASLEGEKQSLTAELAALEEKQRETERQSAAWHEEYDKTIHSRSWRLTKPLRDIQQAIAPKGK